MILKIFLQSIRYPKEPAAILNMFVTKILDSLFFILNMFVTKSLDSIFVILNIFVTKSLDRIYSLPKSTCRYFKHVCY